MHLRFVRSSLAGVVALLVFAGGQLSAQTTTTKKPAAPAKSDDHHRQVNSREDDDRQDPANAEPVWPGPGPTPPSAPVARPPRVPANGRGLKPRP